MNKYKLVNGKKLRYGFTTGSCCAGLAKAGVFVLFNKIDIKHIEISTKKWELCIPLKTLKKEGNFIICSVIKDAGDDPDITNGVEIFAKIREIKEDGIKIKAGIGIGKVTKKGLQVPIGNPAINPEPMKMINREILKVLPKGRGVEIEFSIPEGIELAKKTFNQKLGIIGGLSVLGTTGIVSPMSEEAFKESLALEISQAIEEEKLSSLVFVPGNFGKKFAIDNLGINENKIIVTSNFIGYMLDKAYEMGIKRLTLIGHIGKFIKLAGGIFNTHSKEADARLEILCANALISGSEREELLNIMNSNTTEEAVSFIKNDICFDIIVKKIIDYVSRRVKGEIEISCLIFSFEKGELARMGDI